MVLARKKCSSSRKRTQGGSAIVEAALIFLPMMALFFAMVDFPIAIFIQNTIRAAVREGVRFAITQEPATGQDAAIKAVVESYSDGFISDALITAGKATFSITYYDGTTLANAGTGTNSNAQGNICVVSASVQHTWMAPVWQSTGILSFSASSSDVMEAPPLGVLPSR